MKLLKGLTMVLLMTFFTGSSFGQQNESADRNPAVAGQFYPGSPDQLSSQLDKLFRNAEPKRFDDVVAVIAPHAGYVFSGEVAASSFNQVDAGRSYDNIFVLASSHHVSFNGASVYKVGDYITPLGKVEVNQELCRDLVEDNKVFTYRRDAHLHEHSLEVQLPFMQHKLGEDIRIVPIVLGTQSPGTCRDIAGALKPYFNSNNLFVISTDFSHYPSYEDAVEVDAFTAKAIVSGDPKEFLSAIEKNRNKNIPNLATSICGWTSVLTLMYLTEGNDKYDYHEVQYKNSGDAEMYGDKFRVVGYHAMAVTGPVEKKKFSLSSEDREELLSLARRTIEVYLEEGISPDVDTASLSNIMKSKYGAFVTLHKKGKLRGCIGMFNPEEPLYETVQNMAIAAATQDYRFPRVKMEELDEIDIEISVLSPMKKIEDVKEIEIGTHGIYIKKGYSSGTLLPQVATEQKWGLEEFLGHCARDKARIGWEGWKDAEIYTYEAFVFGEEKH
jgi:hypothetical protein